MAQPARSTDFQTARLDSSPVIDSGAQDVTNSRVGGATVGTSVMVNVTKDIKAVDEAWHAARSSGNALLPTISGAPSRKKHVFVEHTNGMFVPQSVHEQLRQAEEQRKLGLMMSQGGKAVGGAGWGEREDAKDFITTVNQLKKIIARVVQLFGSFSFGFCAFQFLFTYADSSNANAERFLPAYSKFYFVQQKIMMISMLILVTFHAFPVAFEFGTRRQKRESVTKTMAQAQHAKNARQLESGGSNLPSGSRLSTSMQATSIVAKSTEDDGTRTGDGYETSLQSTKILNMLYGKTMASPLRHLFSVQFICYIVSLAATIIVTSVEEGRDEEAVLHISDSLLSRLQIALIIRTVALGIASIASLKSQR